MRRPKTSDQLILLSKILDKVAINIDSSIRYCTTINDIGATGDSSNRNVRPCNSLELLGPDCDICPLRTTKQLEETIKTLQVLGE